MFSNKCFNLPSKVNFRSICCRLDCKRKLCKEAMVGHILRPPVKLLLVWPQKFLSKVSLIQSFLWTILKAFLEPSHAYKLSNIFGKIAVNRSDSKWISAYPIFMEKAKFLLSVLKNWLIWTQIVLKDAFLIIVCKMKHLIS